MPIAQRISVLGIDVAGEARLSLGYRFDPDDAIALSAGHSVRSTPSSVAVNPLVARPRRSGTACVSFAPGMVDDVQNASPGTVALLVTHASSVARFFDLAEELGGQLFLDVGRFVRAARNFRVAVVDARLDEAVEIVERTRAAAPETLLVPVLPADDEDVELALRRAGVLHVALGKVEVSTVREIVRRSARLSPARTNCPPPRPAGGFTLIEVMVATAILGTVLMLATGALLARHRAAIVPELRTSGGPASSTTAIGLALRDSLGSLRRECALPAVPRLAEALKDAAEVAAAAHAALVKITGRNLPPSCRAWRDWLAEEQGGTR